MMDKQMDIVERLRQEGEDAMRKHCSLGMWKLCAEAADEIERLRDFCRKVAQDNIDRGAVKIADEQKAPDKKPGDPRLPGGKYYPA